MVSSSTIKKENAEHSQKNLNKSPGGKYLRKYRFYLDVKNGRNSQKVEAKLKELGLVLDIFLTKEVTHVVTDQEEWCNSKGGGSNPKTPQILANDLHDNEFDAPPKKRVGRIRPKTRADAMLEKARKSSISNVCTKNPLDDAKLWGITIWTVDETLSWLERIKASVVVKKKESKVFQLRAPYLKFEAFDRQTRPVFKEIPNWPEINFQGSVGDPGLVCRSSAERNMTRKTRSHRPRLDTALQPGYCEVCRADYPRLDKHLESEKHQSFISDSVNYLELDALISDGSNIEAFLKLKVELDEKALDLEDNYIPPTTRNKMPRTRTSSLCDKIKSSQFSSTASERSQRLRPRFNNISNNCLGGSVYDEITLKDDGVRETRELRSSVRLSNLKTENEYVWESGRPKRSCINKKRISADERLVVDNKSYYKVEVVSSKLRSSGIPGREHEVVQRIQTPIPEEVVEERDKGLIVKFRRMRPSELKQLNNEAENFLFPHKDDSSSDDDIDADNPNSTIDSTKQESTVLLSSEDEKPLSKLKNDIEECSMDSTCSEASNPKRRKRRTQAEAFILDNQKYYKFETPGSRLRYHGSFMPQISVQKSPRNNGELVAKTKEKENKEQKIVKKEVVKEKREAKEKKDQKEREIVKEKKEVAKEKKYVKDREIVKEKQILKEKKDTKENAKEKKDIREKESVKEKKETKENENVKEEDSLDDFTFSFERIPKSEPWFQTFQRQDEGREYYHCFSDSGFWKPFLLPYELPPLPPLDPNTCISVYENLKKQILGSVSSATSTSCSTPEVGSASGSEANSAGLHEDSSKSSEDSMATLASKVSEQISEETDSEQPKKPGRRKRKGILLPSKNPRKSPRQHASTLAILSSLIHQRKKRDLNRLRDSEENTSKSLLTSIPEYPVSSGTDYDRMMKNLNEMLASSRNIEEIEFPIPLDDTRCINVGYNSDAIQILEDYEAQKGKKSTISSSLLKKPFNTPGRKPGRKKKKNRTGWPNKNRRVVLKKDVKDETIDGSTVDSLSTEDTEDAREDQIKTEYNEEANSIKKSELCGRLVNNVDQNSLSSDLCSAENKEQKNNSDKEDRVNMNKEHSLAKNCNFNKNVGKLERCVDLEKWEHAEKILSAKLTNSDSLNSDVQLQPYVRVQKLSSEVTVNRGIRRQRSSSPCRTNIKRPRRMPASPKSPRILRKPRGRWYRER